MRKPNLRIPRVKRTTTQPSTAWASNDDRNRYSPAIRRRRCDGYELVKSIRDEIRKLHLGHRTIAEKRCTDRHPDDSSFCNWRIDHSIAAILGKEPFRCFECSPVDSNVFANEKNAIIATHLIAECVVDRVNVSSNQNGWPTVR